MKRESLVPCLILFLFFSGACFSQDISARISVINGGRVFFQFNSLRDFENGIELTDYTTIALTVVDNDPGGGGTGAPDIIQNFQVTVESFSSAGGDLVGTSGANLDADYIEVIPKRIAANGLDTPTESYNSIFLSGAPQTILYSTQVEARWTTHQFNITYKCNPSEQGGNTLYGEVQDYYTTTLAFDLDVTFVP